jgi:hypothetical protein
MTVWHTLTQGVWPCGVCHRGRQFDDVTVIYKRFRGLEDSFPETRFNLKVCVDSPECREIAEAAPCWPPPLEPRVSRYDGHEHDWPGDLDDAICQEPGCGLPYDEWTVEGPDE